VHAIVPAAFIELANREELTAERAGAAGFHQSLPRLADLVGFQAQLGDD
jgi:hypothetical protein